MTCPGICAMNTSQLAAPKGPPGGLFGLASITNRVRSDTRFAMVARSSAPSINGTAVTAAPARAMLDRYAGNEGDPTIASSPGPRVARAIAASALGEGPRGFSLAERSITPRLAQNSHLGNRLVPAACASRAAQVS